MPDNLPQPETSQHHSFPEPSASSRDLASLVKAEATRLGFDLAGICAAGIPETLGHLQHWLDAGHAGEMHYMDRRRDAYSHPSGVLPNVRSIIVVALNYAPAEPPHSGTALGEVSSTSASSDVAGLVSSGPPATARVAAYARGSADYHDVLRAKLKLLAAVLHEHRPGCHTRGVVDTAPLLERDVGRTAGLGWFGKNTMLINRRLGSRFFLGALLTDVELPPDEPHVTNHCGTCTRCLEACPTDAFVAPYELDARRCISYLTIEFRDRPIPEDLREGMGDWVFGCDICQDVCPWNRKAPVSTVPEFQPVPDLHPVTLPWLLSLTADEFQQRFRHTPLNRSGRSGVLRNAAIAAGNSGDRSLVPALTNLLSDPDPLIHTAAAWALNKLETTSVAETSLRDEPSL